MSQKRQTPPTLAPEREMLLSFLDFHRATILHKVEGVSEEDLRRAVLPPSTLTLLGLLKHLAYNEVWWFQCQFKGMSDPYPEAQDDPGFDFRLKPNETAAEVVSFYQSQVDKAREIIHNAKLEDLSFGTNKTGKRFSLRFIIMHMIQETARHNGHADLLRQAIDGATGV